jgi:hypothetical protein
MKLEGTYITMALLQWSNKEKIAKYLLGNLTSATEHLYIKYNAVPNGHPAFAAS